MGDEYTTPFDQLSESSKERLMELARAALESFTFQDA